MTKLLPAILVTFVACSPAAPNPEIAKPIPLLLDAASGPGFVTPSKWMLSSTARWRPITTLDLENNTRLQAGEGGERWLETDSSRESATVLAPERILGIQKADGYRFVGESGTVYSAHDPLGSLSRTGLPVDGARQVAVGKVAILVVNGKGELLRSLDGGHTWNKSDVPQKDSVIVDVAMLGDKGLLVVAPQRFFGTKDDGATWTAVKSPGIGVAAIVARDGALWLDGVEENLHYDPAWGTFSAGTSSGHTKRSITSAKAADITQRRIDGRHTVEISGTQRERSWSLAVGDISALGKPRHVEEFDGCEYVNPAMRGERIVVACDAQGTLSSGIDKDASVSPTYYGKRFGGKGAQQATLDGGSLGWITRIFKSDDSGRSFQVETTIEGGVPQRFDEAIAIGPEDFIYLGRRCGPGYNAACLPPRVRGSKTAGFSEVPSDDEGGQVHFATSTLQSNAYSIGMRDSEAFLFRWKSGSAAPEAISRIADAVDVTSATVSLDDDGTVRGFLRSSGKPTTFQFREGSTIATQSVSAPLSHAAFSGVHGFAIGTDQKGYESVDGGKTWGVVALPAFAQAIDSCGTYGCVTDRGLRWGWDAPPTTASVASKPTAQYQRPLRCSAKDKWVDVGGGNIPTIRAVDHGASRWVMPTRDKDGKIAVAISKRGDPTTKTTTVALMGAPPGPPKFGAGTTMHVQPGGVVAVRYSYPRDRKGPGRYNPVDAQVVWYRDGGKVLRASVSKLAPFRVNKDPQGGYERTEPGFAAILPEVISLAQNGLYFRPPANDEYDDATSTSKPAPLFLLKDDGKQDKLKFPEGLEAGGVAIVASLDGSNTLLAQDPEHWMGLTLADGKKYFWSVLGGLGEEDGVVDWMNLGGKPGLVATLRDPARAWAIGLKADAELGAVTAIATQKSLGDTPKACDGPPSADPNDYRIDAPYVVGSRRPVIVDADGVAIVLATNREEIRGSLGQTNACVAAYDAEAASQDGDHDFGALVFADDMGHSLLFRADTSNWPAIVAVRPMECQYQAGPLPEELEAMEGFVPDTRHAAVVRKRY